MTATGQEEIDDGDVVDPAGPLQGGPARLRARQRTLYLAASLLDRGFAPQLPARDAGEAPALRYLRPAVDLVRLLSHGARLFTEVLPPIRARLSFTPVRVVEARPFQVRGPLDVPATLRGAAARAETHPTVLVSRRPQREHDTPENILTALTVRTVQSDAARLRRALNTRLQVTELTELGRLAASAGRFLRLPQLSAVALALDDALLDDPAGPPARALEARVRQRALQQPRALGPYLGLVEWREAYRRWFADAQRGAADAASWETDDNTLYEHLVLLELADAFSRRARRSTQRRGRGAAGQQPLFAFLLPDGRQVELWYQTGMGRQRYTNLRAMPDVTIRVGTRVILGDMKNYATANYSAALYKMFGYLYNFGYPDRWHEIEGGVLFFPQPDGHHHPGYRRLTTRRPGEQWIASLVVPPEGSDRNTRAWADAFVDEVVRPPSVGQE